MGGDEFSDTTGRVFQIVLFRPCDSTHMQRIVCQVYRGRLVFRTAVYAGEVDTWTF